MSDINNRVESIKSKLENMINNLQLADAKKYLQQFREILPEEKEIVSYEIVIEILEGNLEKAEALALSSLNEDPISKDIIFNLGYINELNGNFQEAYDFYMECISLSDGKSEEIEQAIIRIKEKGISLKEKKRVVFFCKNGLDSFLGEVIEGLSAEYQTRKIIITNLEEINNGMKWADICWFEWCDELVVFASKLPIAKQKRIICRIHGYEVYTENILKVNWALVDHLIIVAPHIKRIFRNKVSDSIVSEDKISLIFCGVNENNYPFHIKKKGYNIGYLGYINYKKNIPLTLKIYHELYKIDKRYTLYLAGTFQDERTMRYVEYFIKDNGLKGKVIYEGWKDFDEKLIWLKKIDYMLISSIDEGLCFAAAESMLSGIKPVLHNCEGIKDHYNDKFIYNTVDEAIKMITLSDYNSFEYKEFVVKNYSITREINEIKNVISCIENCKNVDDFDYKLYWDERYQNGGNSGDGSYGLLAFFKANVINDFVKENSIEEIIEFGCGDGNQLGLMGYRKYLGLDISPTAVKKCKNLYKNDPLKTFQVYNLNANNKNYPTADLVVCLDVLYHIIDEIDFIKTLDDIFLSSKKYVILYTVLEEPHEKWSVHLKYRNVFEYIKKYNFSIEKIIKQQHKELSAADFIILKKNKMNFSS